MLQCDHNSVFDITENNTVLIFYEEIGWILENDLYLFLLEIICDCYYHPT